MHAASNHNVAKTVTKCRRKFHSAGEWSARLLLISGVARQFVPPPGGEKMWAWQAEIKGKMLMICGVGYSAGCSSPGYITVVTDYYMLLLIMTFCCI